MPFVEVTDNDILRIDTEQFPEITAVEWFEYDHRLYLHGDLRQLYTHIISNPDVRSLGSGGVPFILRLQTLTGVDETFNCLATRWEPTAEFSFLRVQDT
jgi:hypothetical protein